MSQEIRNKAYLVVAGIAGVLLVLGVVDQAQQDVALDVTERALDVVDNVLALVVALAAWWKSRPSAVTVVGVPKSEVTHKTPDGEPDQVVLEGVNGSLVSAPVA